MRRSWWLWVVMVGWGCAERDPGEMSAPCDGDTQARELAGVGAVDCGVVMIGRDPSVVDACVLDAFRRGQPFVARYDRPGTDSHTALFLSFRDGVYTELSWDSYGSCSTCPTVTARSCDDAVEAGSPTALPDGGPASTSPTAPLACPSDPPRETLCQ